MLSIGGQGLTDEPGELAQSLCHEESTTNTVMMKIMIVIILGPTSTKPVRMNIEVKQSYYYYHAIIIIFHKCR